MKCLDEYVSEFMFSDPSRRWGGVMKCKNPKFIEGRNVVYYMKGFDE